MSFPTPAPSLASSTLSSARSLMALQLGSRLLTFALNQALPRLASPRAFGTAAIQFELLSSTLLFLPREGVRGALLRTPAERRADPRVQHVACLPLILGLPLALGAAIAYIGSAATATGAQSGFRIAVAGYAIAAIIELASEPMHNQAMGKLQTGVRVRAEGVGITSKTIVTFLVLLLDATRGEQAGELALIAFAAGQLAYALCLFTVYRAHYRDTTLLPRLEKQMFSYLDGPTWGLAKTMTVHSLVKHILTEGDKVVLAWLSPLQDQGGYAVAVNYGSLVARIVFQPIEEISRVFFSKLLPDAQPKNVRNALRQAADALLSLLSVQVSFTVLLLVFGTAYMPIALHILLPPRYLATSAPSVLAAWVWYIPVLAVNGGLEAFLASVATEKDLNRQSRWMVVFSVIYIATALALYTLKLGDTSLVYANVVNLSARIAYSLRFVASYFTSRQAGDLLRWRDVIPAWPLLLLSTASYALVVYSDRTLGVTAILATEGRRAILTVPIMMHVALGGVLGLTCLAAWWRSSGRFLAYPKRIKEQ